jgi:hypothetical protein
VANDKQDLLIRVRTAGAQLSSREVRGLRKELRETERGARRTHGAFRMLTGGIGNFALIAGSGGAALGVAGFAGGARIAISAASDLHEEITKTRVVFRGVEADALNWSKQMDVAFGQSQQQALAAVTNFGGFFKVAGKGRAEALNLSKSMVELGGDLASFNNSSPEEALDALRSGLSGEAEPLRRFRVFLSDARIQALALSRGIDTSANPLTENQKIMLRYNLILRDTKDAQGDFARTSGGLANQQRILRAEITNLEAEIGTALLPTALKVTSALAGFVKGIRSGTGAGGKFADIAEGVGGTLKGMWKWGTKNGAMLAELTGVVIAGAAAWRAYMVIKRVLVLMEAARVLFIAWRAGVLSMTAAQLGLNSALLANPVGIVIIAIAALVAALVVAYNKVGWFHDGVDAAFGAVKTAVGGTVDFIKRIWPTIWSVVKWSPMIAPLRIALGAVRAIFKDGFRGLVNFFISQINSVIAIGNRAIHGINAVRPFGDIPDIPGIGLLDDRRPKADPFAGAEPLLKRPPALARGGARSGAARRPLSVPSPFPQFAHASGGTIVVESHSHTYLDGKKLTESVERHVARRRAQR